MDSSIHLKIDLEIYLSKLFIITYMFGFVSLLCKIPQRLQILSFRQIYLNVFSLVSKLLSYANEVINLFKKDKVKIILSDLSSQTCLGLFQKTTQDFVSSNKRNKLSQSMIQICVDTYISNLIHQFLVHDTIFWI